MKELVKKIIAVMEAVEYLKKDGKVEFKTTKYKYLSEEKITGAIRIEMIKQKLIMYPKRVEIKEAQTNFEKVVVTYCITDGTESIEIQSAGEGLDYGDKSIYKAMTGAFKYAQRQTFMISTGDDPDKDSSEKLVKDIEKAEAKKKTDLIVSITDHCKNMLGMNGKVFKEIFGVSNMTVLSFDDLVELEEKAMARKPYVNGNGEHDFKIEQFERENVQAQGETVNMLLVRQIKWLVDATGESVSEDITKMKQNELLAIRNGLYAKFMTS